MQKLSVVRVAVLNEAIADQNPVESAGAEREQVVRFEDLDLTRSAGVEQLYQRIRVAARKVCCKPDELKLPAVIRSRRLAEEVTARAIAAVNAPALTQYYAMRSQSVYYSGIH